MHTLIVNIHIFANVFFSIFAILLCTHSILGYKRLRIYSKTQVCLEYGFLGFLYFGLLLGIILYFFFHQSDELIKMSIQDRQKQHNSQFWGIEHFSVMVFALMIAQIGKIFTSKSISDKDKYKYALFYYGIATLIIFISMSVYLYYKLQ